MTRSAHRRRTPRLTLFPLVALTVGAVAFNGGIRYAQAHVAPPLLETVSSREAVKKMLSTLPSDTEIPICGQTYGVRPLTYALPRGEYDRLGVVCPDHSSHIVEIP